MLNILLLAVLIVCEGANALMHFGDYKYFPMRMGYALAFSFVWAAGYYSKYLKLNKLNFNEKQEKRFACFIQFCFVCLPYGINVFCAQKLDGAYEFKYSVLYAMPVLISIYLVIFAVKTRWLITERRFRLWLPKRLL